VPDMLGHGRRGSQETRGLVPRAQIFLEEPDGNSTQWLSIGEQQHLRLVSQGQPMRSTRRTSVKKDVIASAGIRPAAMNTGRYP
jgi:hypothetical protein